MKIHAYCLNIIVEVNGSRQIYNNIIGFYNEFSYFIAIHSKINHTGAAKRWMNTWSGT